MRLLALLRGARGAVQLRAQRVRLALRLRKLRLRRARHAVQLADGLLGRRAVKRRLLRRRRRLRRRAKRRRLRVGGARGAGGDGTCSGSGRFRSGTLGFGISRFQVARLARRLLRLGLGALRLGGGVARRRVGARRRRRRALELDVERVDARLLLGEHLAQARLAALRLLVRLARLRLGHLQHARPLGALLEEKLVSRASRAARARERGFGFFVLRALLLAHRRQRGGVVAVARRGAHQRVEREIRRARGDARRRETLVFFSFFIFASLEVRERLGGGGELRGVLHRRHLRAAL